MGRDYDKDPEKLKGMLEASHEAIRQGARGAAHDFHIEARPWGFDLSEIKIPVKIYHGALDTAAPAECGRILSNIIPNATYKEFPEDGHSLFAYNIEEFLTTVI